VRIGEYRKGLAFAQTGTHDSAARRERSPFLFDRGCATRLRTITVSEIGPEGNNRALYTSCR
jgi:hypothetical protein